MVGVLLATLWFSVAFWHRLLSLLKEELSKLTEGKETLEGTYHIQSGLSWFTVN